MLSGAQTFKLSVDHNCYARAKSFAFFHAMGCQNDRSAVVSNFADNVPKIALRFWIQSVNALFSDIYFSLIFKIVLPSRRFI